MLNVDADSFLVIVLASAIAAAIVGVGGGRVIIPVVVLELGLGILIGPDVLGLAQPDPFIDFFASLGLGMLFFFAGYEIDFERIRGAPLKLAAIGWLISLALAYTIGGALAAAGIVLSLLFTGSALATTAMSTKAARSRALDNGLPAEKKIVISRIGPNSPTAPAASR